ncbi:hypothetical protein BJX64DRAFT_24272 [Aspergillus heterothallicus]
MLLWRTATERFLWASRPDSQIASSIDSSIASFVSCLLSLVSCLCRLCLLHLADSSLDPVSIIAVASLPTLIQIFFLRVPPRIPLYRASVIVSGAHSC